MRGWKKLKWKWLVEFRDTCNSDNKIHYLRSVAVCQCCALIVPPQAKALANSLSSREQLGYIDADRGSTRRSPPQSGLLCNHSSFSEAWQWKNPWLSWGVKYARGIAIVGAFAEVNDARVAGAVDTGSNLCILRRKRFILGRATCP